VKLSFDHESYQGVIPSAIRTRRTVAPNRESRTGGTRASCSGGRKAARRHV